MMEWVSTAWIGVVVILMLWLPGLAVGYLGGLRGIIAWGSAPLLSGGVIGVAAIAGGLLGVSWSLLVVVVATVIAATLAWTLRRVAGGWRSPSVRTDVRVRRTLAGTVAVAFVGAAGFQMKRLLGAMGSTENFPQTYDTPFHLNSVRLIQATGDASSLHMTLTSPESSTSFYPGLWHGITALVAGLAPSQELPVSANWVTAVVACLVWPASMLALARVLFGPRPVYLGLTAVLCFSMPQFPNRLTTFGILYPNLLSYAMLPALLALLWLALWRARGRGRAAPVILAAVGAVSIALAQPNGLFAIGYLLVPILGHYAGHLSLRQRRAGARMARVVAPWVVLVVVCLGSYWAAGQIGMVAEFRSQVSWEVKYTRQEAIDSFLSAATTNPDQSSNTLVAILVFVGFIACLFVARWRWIPFGYALLCVLFYVSAAARLQWREVLTGYWYGDPERLAAQLPLLAVPLAVIGMVVVLRGLSELALLHGPEGEWWRRSTSVTALATVAALAIVVVLPRTHVFRISFASTRAVYAPQDPEHSVGLIDENEARLMDAIERIVPGDTTVAGNPWNGSSMTWALADRRALFPHAKAPSTQDQMIIAKDLGDAGTDPRVCEALEHTGVEYVMTSDTWLWGVHDPGFGGLERATVAKVGELVARYGQARLYRITACD